MLNNSPIPDEVERASITYEVLREASAVTTVSAEWDSLLAQSPCNRVFSSSKWFLAWCHTVSTFSPYVIVARRGGAVAGVLPLVVTPDQQAEFPGKLSDYNDIIAGQDDLPILTGLLAHAIAAQDYERLVLKCIRADSNCLRALRSLYPAGEIEPFRYTRTEVCPHIQLPASYDEYLATRSGVFREGLMRVRRKAEKNNVVVREVTPETFSPDRLPQAYLSLHLSRFGDRSWAKPALYPFVEEAFPALFAERRMRVFALFEEEKMIAMHLCMVGPDSLCYWSSGFLPEAADWSPGRLLFDFQLRQCCATGVREYDLLRGEEAYKAKWATGVRDIGQFEFLLNRQM